MCELFVFGTTESYTFHSVKDICPRLRSRSRSQALALDIGYKLSCSMKVEARAGAWVGGGRSHGNLMYVHVFLLCTYSIRFDSILVGCSGTDL
jgi:hypothetical protein